MRKQAALQKERSVEIDGLKDFPLEVLGLTPESIEMSNGHIIIPRELLPYIKICRMPVNYRERNAERIQRYRLSLKVRDKHKKLPTRGGAQ